MSRAFCIPGIFFIFAALVLNFLVSISLPYLTALDVARATVNTGISAGNVDSGVREVRFGVWSSCAYTDDGTKTCRDAKPAYSVGFSDPKEQDVSVTVGPSWTRGLVLHPIATGVTFIALLFSFSTHIAVSLIASLLSFLSAVLTLIAFAIDIALFVYVKHQVKKLPNVDGTGKPGPGFWMTLVAFVILLLAGCTVCFGRRRQRMSSATAYPMTEAKAPFWKRAFRRN
ncbi:SUR7/PalI family-domain-containing protein [Schizophyllum commune]